MALERVLISGAGGALAKALATCVREAGARCYGISRGNNPVEGYERILSFGDAPWRAEQWRGALHEVRPDAVFHLAGRRSGAEAEVLAANVECATSLFAGADALSTAAPLVIAGSAAEYGAALRDGAPTPESTHCAPTSPYGRAKLLQTAAALAFARASGRRAVIARIFNAIGPGMPDYLALGDFAAQIAAAPAEGGVLVTGNLDVAQDFFDYTAAAATLLALAQHAHASGLYNVCSGEATPLRAYVEAMVSASGKSITIRVDPTRERVGEPKAVFGDPGRLRTLGIAAPPPALPSVAGAILREALSARAQQPRPVR